MTKCYNCGDEIDFKESQKTGKKYPVNTNGSFHNCREKKSDKPPSESRAKQTRWEGIRVVREVKFREINEYLVNGWVILDRVERVIFVQQGEELKEASESIYVVGQRT